MKKLLQLTSKKLNFIFILSIGFIFLLLSSSFKTKTVACGGPFQSGNILGNSFAILGPGGAGAPGEGGTCGRAGSCHNTTDNIGIGSVTLDIGGGATQYLPGQTYTVTVSASHPSFTAIDFEVTNRPQSGGASTIGTFSITDLAGTIRTKITNGNFGGAGTNYVEGTACGVDVISPGFNQWTFNWTAPLTATGNITFYLGVVAANFNNASNGDFTYSTSKVLTQGGGVGIRELNSETNFSMYPNPTKENFNLNYNLKKECMVEIKIIDLKGAQIAILETEKQSAGEHFKIFNLSKRYAPGIYFVHLSIDGQISSRKLVIQ